jgi:hypothetical protein
MRAEQLATPARAGVLRLGVLLLLALAVVTPARAAMITLSAIDAEFNNQN